MMLQHNRILIKKIELGQIQWRQAMPLRTKWRRILDLIRYLTALTRS
uniref:Uncharacterized protein n=1 Tax=Arundo donax TaxID=35708 RepID=A0A0A9BVU5_ARUDO